MIETLADEDDFGSFVHKLLQSTHSLQLQVRL